MVLTRSFKDLVQQCVASDPAFGEALLREAIEVMPTGDVDAGKASDLSHSIVAHYERHARAWDTDRRDSV